MSTTTLTMRAWQAICMGGYREAEYACDYYYKNGVYIGHSDPYYTGNYR